MPDQQEPLARGQHGLGPHVVGQRVVVRTVVRGETGPTGGPALTDLLGTCLAFTHESLTVLPDGRDGATPVTVPLHLVVSGKPVPPRTPPRLRVDAEEAQRRAAAGWRAPTEEPLGSWVLRAAGGYTRRACSALAVGDPGLPTDQALAAVTGFYADRGLTPRLQVVVGSPEQARAQEAGWVVEEQAHLLLGSVAGVARSLRRDPRTADLDSRDDLEDLGPALAGELLDRPDAAWWASDERAARHHEDAAAVLEHGEVALLRVGDPTLCRGRAAYARDWVGLSCLWTDPAHRGRGLGRAVVGELLAWGAERGATTVYLQVAEENTAALRLYLALGLTVHHTYAYLVPGTPGQPPAHPPGCGLHDSRR